MKTLLQEFEYQRPTSLNEAVTLMGEPGDDVRVIAGGTDLVVKMAEGKMNPKTLIDINDILELSGIQEQEGSLSIGAATPFSAIETSSLIQEKALILGKAAGSIGNAQIRNRGTIGGNLANGSPAADSATVLLALDGEAVLAGSAGERVVPLSDFFVDAEKTIIQPNEILKAVQIQISERVSSAFIKLGRRQAACLSVVNTAVALTMEGDVCTKARIALGAVAPIPMRATVAESHLAGKTLTPEVIQQAADLAANETTPISDIRASREYRKEMSRVLVRRGINEALQDSREEKV